MALASLATAADLAARDILVEDGETDLAVRFLADASAEVRRAAGVPISETTSTVTLPGTDGVYLDLPGTPVTDVDAVLLDGVAVTDWRLVGDALWRRAGWQTRCDEPSLVTVTQTHGLAEVPDDIVGLVCSLTANALVASRESDGVGLPAPGVTSERMGNWQASYESSASRPDVVIAVGAATERQLRARFGAGVGQPRSR